MAQECLKILLIEHDGSYARYVVEMLAQAREVCPEVRLASTLKQGLEFLRSEPFDMILLDLFILDGAGLANVPLAHAIAPQTPIIVGGESDDEVVAVEAVQAHPSYCPSKQESCATVARTKRP